MSDPDAEDLRGRARALLLSGDTAGGIDDLKAHLQGQPDDAGAWLELGTAYAAVEHRAQAVEALRNAVDLDPAVLDARLAFARALSRVGKIDDAAFQLLQANRVAPDDARVMKELGVAFYDKRLFDKAATWLRKAVEAAPDDPRAAYALGLAEEARHDMAAALAAYRQAVRLDDTFFDARQTLADALAQMGEHELAVAELDALLRLDRRQEQAAKNRQILLGALEQMRRSRLLGKTAVEVEASALVERGGLTRKASDPRDDGGSRARYAAPLLELDVGFDAAGAVDELMWLLPAPERAAAERDDRFEVTVLDAAGHPRPVDLGTAATLTFLREALGCPMTEAAALLSRLTGGAAEVTWNGATVSFATAPGGGARERHGLRVQTKRTT